MFSLLKTSFRKKQKHFLLVVIPLIISTSFHCIKTPLEPILPTWDVPLSFQVIDKTYSVQELLDKDTNFYTVPTGEVVYHPETPKTSPTPITFPNVNPFPGKIVNKLDLVPFNIPAIQTLGFSFQDLVDKAPPTTPWVGGEQTFSHTQTIISDTNAYEYINFKEGRINLTVTNAFNFDIDFSQVSPNNGVVIKNESDQSIVGFFDVGQVSANTSKTVSVSLTGKTMYAVLQVAFSAKTLNLNGKKIDSQAKLSFATSIDGGTQNTSAKVHAAKVQLVNNFPSVNFSDSHTLDSAFLKRAEFRSGSFDIKITSHIPVDIVLSFSSKEFIEKSTGKSFRLKDNFGIPQDSITIPAGTTYQQRMNISDYVIQSQEKFGNDTLPVDNISFYSNFKTIIKNNEKILISEEDSLTVEIIPVEFPYVLDNIVGKLKPTIFDLSDTVDVNLGKLGEKITVDSITFENISTVIKMYSPSSFPADVQFTIVAQHQGMNGNVVLKSPSGNGGLNGAYRLVEGDTTTIVLNKNNSTIDKFFSQFFTGGKISLPDKFLIYANATVFPQDIYTNPSTVGYLHNGDSIYTTLEFAIPINVGISNASYRDTVSFDPEISSSIKEGKIDFYFENKFPFEFDFSLRFFKAQQNDSTKPDTKEVVLSFPQKINDPKVYPALGVKGDTTPERKGMKGYTYVNLTLEEAKKLTSARFMALDFRMKTVGNGPPVKFTKVDKLRIKAIANLKYEVKQ